ncbi:hypothetical protein EVAR_36922_1 [Eumeta japonica]|uniref:Uncharacterized protein n=1 Tax=Eumeta variegata TaxID=151549 RepID=A0A4C1X5L3_EUMVA|nr:hypothetical protein EVAR_36922_1 [Eumeta japonica]
MNFRLCAHHLRSRSAASDGAGAARLDLVMKVVLCRAARSRRRPRSDSGVEAVVSERRTRVKVFSLHILHLHFSQYRSAADSLLSPQIQNFAKESDLDRPTTGAAARGRHHDRGPHTVIIFPFLFRPVVRRDVFRKRFLIPHFLSAVLSHLVACVLRFDGSICCLERGAGGPDAGVTALSPSAPAPALLR